jgi:hypothetical protein
MRLRRERPRGASHLTHRASPSDVVPIFRSRLELE